MIKRKGKPLTKRLTAQDLTLIAVASSVLIWAGVLNLLLV